MKVYDVVVIGGGPGGLASAIEAHKEGAKVLLIERERRLGGILKQCIHDGFGLITFHEKLSGPEYTERFVKMFEDLDIDCEILTFVTRIEQDENNDYIITYVNKLGVHHVLSHTLVLATGCRERSAKQVWIHGTRPAGVFTAGTAQSFVNIQGQLVAKNCVILGSGDIGLIMARRLTLEGANVIGVYEVKSEPSGLTRNIVQCLDDFNIPLYLSHTVTRVFGHDRLNAVEISKVDDHFQPIDGTQTIVPCDTLILSVGLIPENEIAERIDVPLCKQTKGPLCDHNFMTLKDGVYSCGNALHVNDLVDYVSESGKLAGKQAAHFTNTKRKLLPIKLDQTLLYVVPQYIDLNHLENSFVMYFRSRKEVNASILTILDEEGNVVFKKRYNKLRPPEMERLVVNVKNIPLHTIKELHMHIEEVD